MTQVRGKCPKCRTAFNVEVEPGAFFLCPGCGARLKSRGETPRPPQITERLEAAVAAAAVAAAETDGTRPVSGEGETPGGAQAAPPPEVAPTPPAPPAAVETPPPASPDASTGEAPTPAETPRPDPSGAPDASHPVAPTPGSSLEELMYSLYVVQKEILETLQSRLGPRGGQEIRQAGDQVVDQSDEFTAMPPAPTRTRRQKTVLLIDDDELTRSAAVAALQQVEVPVRTVSDAPQALAALTEHRPDVIVLEPELAGDTSGDDLVNTIKATIEWVDIPIVLFTRADVTSQDEARIRGADEFVLKGPRGAEALVSQVITLFRKG